MWCTKSVRVLSPGGIASITTHGTRWFDLLYEGRRARFEANELVVLDGGAPGGNSFGTFQIETNVRRLVAGRLEIVDFAISGALGLIGQDMYCPAATSVAAHLPGVGITSTGCVHEL